MHFAWSQEQTVSSAWLELWVPAQGPAKRKTHKLTSRGSVDDLL